MKTWLLCLLIVGSLPVLPGRLAGQWNRQNSGITSDLTDVVMLDSATVYAVSRGRSILRTTDGGETWGDLTAPLSYVMPWNGLAFHDSENGLAVGDYGTVFTVKGGDMAGWCRNIGKTPIHLLSALYVSPADIYVGADSGWIYNSLDSGRTWSAEKISEWPIRSIFAWRGTYTMGLPLYALTSHSICTRTEYPPTAWSEIMIPQLQGLGAEAFDGGFSNGGAPGFIVGVGGDFWASPLILRGLRSDTSGWGTLSGVPGSGPLYGVSAPSADVIYACGTMGLIAKSRDGGDSWNRSPLPPNMIEEPDLLAICFIDENHGFAVGRSGSVFHTSNGGLTAVDSHEPKIPADFILEQNYPNPFNPSTVIEFGVRSSGFLSLKVYDVLGREVVTLIDGKRKSAGRYSVRWDGTDRNGLRVASGIYFYELATQAGRQMKKAVIMR